MKLFILSSHCNSGTRCVRCRDKEGGRDWRIFMAHLFELPPGGFDFECPIGKLWAERERPEAIAEESLVIEGGPGTELMKLLHGFGVRACGRCRQRADEMDRRGVAWCEKNIATILDWLATEAAARGLPFTQAAAALLVKRAIGIAD